ncbi:MAG: RidA family protein, partial [bacterium]|nr:RidA family protein [bacterium]
MSNLSHNPVPEAAGFIPGRLLFTSAFGRDFGSSTDQAHRVVETLGHLLDRTETHRVIHGTAFFADPNAHAIETRTILYTAFGSQPAITEHLVDRLTNPNTSFELALTADLGEPLPDEPLIHRINLEPHGQNLSQGIIVNGGRLLYLAGQVANNPDGSTEAPNDLARQTQTIYRNIEDILQAGGATLKHIVHETIWVLNMETWLTQGSPVRHTIHNNLFPATSIAQIRALSHPEQMVEIEVIAV